MKKLAAIAAVTVFSVAASTTLSLAQSNRQAFIQAVDLGSAANFVILSKAGISTTGVTKIVGNLGVSPIAAAAITGFGLKKDPSGEFSTSSLVTGRIYAANYSTPTPAMLTTAIGDMQIAYRDAAGRKNPRATELGSGNIGGLTIRPGLYKWSSNVTIPSDVTISGGPNAVWIFQIAGTLDISPGKNVILINGAQAKNIFWQVAGKTTIETTAVFNGNILDKTQVTMKTGARLYGRALAQTAVTLDASRIRKNSPLSPAAAKSRGPTIRLESLSTSQL
jgi:hypothetical protein